MTMCVCKRTVISVKICRALRRSAGALESHRPSLSLRSMRSICFSTSFSYRSADPRDKGCPQLGRAGLDDRARRAAAGSAPRARGAVAQAWRSHARIVAVEHHLALLHAQLLPGGRAAQRGLDEAAPEHLLAGAPFAGGDGRQARRERLLEDQVWQPQAQRGVALRHECPEALRPQPDSLRGAGGADVLKAELRLEQSYRLVELDRIGRAVARLLAQHRLHRPLALEARAADWRQRSLRLCRHVGRVAFAVVAARVERLVPAEGLQRHLGQARVEGGEHEARAVAVDAAQLEAMRQRKVVECRLPPVVAHVRIGAALEQLLAHAVRVVRRRQVEQRDPKVECVWRGLRVFGEDRKLRVALERLLRASRRLSPHKVTVVLPFGILRVVGVADKERLLLLDQQLLQLAAREHRGAGPLPELARRSRRRVLLLCGCFRRVLLARAGAH
eukprot:7385457-Prymnesium_polylepis.1